MPVIRRVRSSNDRGTDFRQRERRDQPRYSRSSPEPFGRSVASVGVFAEEPMAMTTAEQNESSGASDQLAAATPGPWASSVIGESSSGLCGFEAKFATPLDRKYVCPVCLSALRDPMQTKCGHRFCKTCLTRASGPGDIAKCPLDKLWFDIRTEVFSDVAMQREVLSLETLCSNADNGCDWTGELRVLEDHTLACPHALVPCSNGCHTLHKRLEADAHQASCPSRLVDCSYCQQAIPFKTVKQHHLLLCPRYAIECPLCGKADILREDMPQHTDHKDGDCPKSIVPCLFGEIGCHAQVSRCDLVLHNQESQGRHLELLVGQSRSQQEQGREQAGAMRDMKETCSRLLGQHVDADRKVSELTQELRLLKNELSLVRSINCNGELHWKVQICSRDFTAPVLSPPFYTSHAGYKLRLCLELRGHVTRSDSYTSLFVMLCKGENDDGLYFPFSAVCALTLFDQSGAENHQTTNITCQKMPRPQEIESSMQRRGRLQFMKTDTLINGRFCKAGMLFFHARVMTRPFTPIN